MKSLKRPWLFVLMLLLFAPPLFAQDSELNIRARQPLEFVRLQLSADEQAWLRQKQSLLVATVNQDFPPYREINDERQEMEGISADFLAALQRELGIPIKVRTYPSIKAAYQALSAGQVDMVDTASRAQAEDHHVLLSPPYAFTELALFAESGDLRDYNSDLSLAHTRIAATHGIGLKHYQSNGGQGLITVYGSPLSAMASVLDGESDVYLGDTLSTSYLSSQLFSRQLVVNVSAQRPEIQVAFAVAPQDRRLYGLLERALGGLDRCQLASALALWGSEETCELNGFRASLEAAERDWLDHAPAVRLVVSEDLAPYAFFNTRGRFSGVTSNVLDIIRHKTGLRFDIIRVSSLSEAYARLHDAGADLSVLTHITPHHASLLFTRPFVTAPYVIVRQKNAPPLKPLDQDASGKAATAMGYLQRDELSRQYPKLQIRETLTIADAFNRVRAGSVDFALAPANLARYYLSYKYESSLKINGVITGQEAQIAFAAPRTQALLTSVLDKAMAQISPQEYLQIVDRWRANSATDDKYWEGVASSIWNTFGGLGVMLALAAWWILSQRQKIIRKRFDLMQRQLILDELRVTKDSAEKASRSKTVFLATMSHEIRTPLNAIIGMLELVLARKNAAALNTRSVQIAHESAQNLLGLIGDILDISRIESGKLTLRPETASLKELILSVSKVFEGLARQKHLDIYLELDALAAEQVWIDSQKFKQILSNLLSNAIKFTDQGCIRIRCQGQDSHDNSLAFSVSVADEGIGIAPSQLQQVFTPFFEIEGAVNNPNAGSGLGLSISHSLSLLMDGHLSVDSEPGVGTTMTFKARFERVSDEVGCLVDEPEQATASAIERPLTVLIVEDHLPSQYLLDQQINYLGHHALIADNGLEGLAMWQEHDIDIIITDCNMPQMSGHEMTQAIRRMEGQLGIRPCVIVGLTASAQPEELERCLSSGMTSALAKPVNLTGLNRVVPMLSRERRPETSAEPAPSDKVPPALAEQVINSNLQELQALRSAMAAGNRSDLNAIAHKLKSTAYLLDIEELLALCLALEQRIADDADEQQLRAVVARLEQALLALNHSLQAH
ncbi:transporter substrate-binding domain-containing protein [Pseudomonas sp. Fl5BN2]|uniref:ATP-binding protein n=1 Tax=Pseudomonas sp. Fl5BN2 TaxID=2697652 RepID=UPI0013770AD6|nr:transporter substrate-binding domain-containing protein [Pseudomonas sp. Fl5BN2]